MQEIVQKFEKKSQSSSQPVQVLQMLESGVDLQNAVDLDTCEHLSSPKLIEDGLIG